VATGKPNHVLTIHMSKGAPKSARLDAAAVRKRASSKGDLVVEVKPGETITALAVAWMLESYIKVAKAEEPKKKEGGKQKAVKAPVKKASKPVAKAKAKPAKKVSKPVKKVPAKKKK
ncbi:MAG: hypothetical protein RIR73_998, partial [Chloroflexota bacterium]